MSDTLDLLVFRVGGERFAADLAAVEEAIELTDVQPLPGMPPSMLGMFALRGRMTALYDPGEALGLTLGAAQAALVLRAGTRRVGIAVDDVEDVLAVPAEAVQAPPTIGKSGGVLLGVTRRGADLVTLVDTDVLLAACVAAPDLENA